MHWRLILALLFMTAAVGPASAQVQRGGQLTETQDRMLNQKSESDLIWNLVGLLGLLGLIGLLPQHEDDSYHPSDID
jgi:hypothetical protein